MEGDPDYDTDDKDMTEAERQNELTLQEYFQPRRATVGKRGASMGPNTTRNNNFNKTTVGKHSTSFNRNLSSARTGEDLEDLADMGQPGIYTKYRAVRNDEIDKRLARWINWKLDMGDESDRLQVTFKLLNPLEPGIYQYGTRKVKVRVTYSDYTERKELQVAEVGNIYVPI